MPKKSFCGAVTFTSEDGIYDDRCDISDHGNTGSRRRNLGQFALSLPEAKAGISKTDSAQLDFLTYGPINPPFLSKPGRSTFLHRSHSDSAIRKNYLAAAGYESPPYSNFARYLPCLSTPSEGTSSSNFSPFSASKSGDTTESSFRLPISASQLSLPEPPDGGYGWVVVFAAFLVHMITEGVIVSFGVFIEDLLEEFGESMSATSWVGSFSYGTPALVTPISSFILNKLGCRITCMLGALISSVGCLAGSFCDSLLALVFTFGILSGIGFSLSMTAALVVVTIYFDDRRATATGLSIAGTGVGALVFAPAVEFLINVYSWRGTFMLMAGAVLHIAICGALMRPVETRIERRHRQRLAWLEHFAKESGMPTIVKSEDYLDRDVLGRIKLLRDRLLAPRKCFGRTHGVVRMPTEYRFEGNQRMHDTSQNVGRPSTHCIQVMEARDTTSNLYALSTLALAAAQSQGSPHNHFSHAKSVSANAPKLLTTMPSDVFVETADVKKFPDPFHRNCSVSNLHQSYSAQHKTAMNPLNTLCNRLCHSNVDVRYTDMWQSKGIVPFARRNSLPLLMGNSLTKIKSKRDELAIYPSAHGDLLHPLPSVPSRIHTVPETVGNTSCPQVDDANTFNRNAVVTQCTNKFRCDRDAVVAVDSHHNVPLGNYKLNLPLFDKSGGQPPDRVDIFYHGSLLKAFGLTRASLCRALSLPDLTQIHRIRRRSGSDGSSTSSSTDSSCITFTCCPWMKHEDSDHEDESYEDGCLYSCLNRLTTRGTLVPEVSMRQVCRSMCDFRLFRRASFDMFLLSNVLLYFWLNVTYFFMGVYALDLGLSETQAALLFSVLGGANMVGEIAVGFLADREWINPLLLYLLMLIACGVSTSLVPLLTSFPTLSLYAGIFGMGLAANDSLCTILLVSFVGLHHLTNALGICFFCQGVANLFGPPTIGYIIDATHSHNWAFIVSGIGLVLSGVVVFPIIIQRIRRRRARRLRRKHTADAAAAASRQINHVDLPSEECAPVA